jgi:hypothetical protein
MLIIYLSRIGHQHTKIDTNNIHTINTLISLTGGKDEENIVLMRKS